MEFPEFTLQAPPCSFRETSGFAGGLAQCDSSGTDPKQGMLAASFPLTLTLSLREREQRASRSGKPTGLDCPPRIEGLTLSPRERDGVRGKHPPHASRGCPGLAVRSMPAALYVFEPFTISSLRLSRRSLTAA